ncbi:MAG TPA: TIGR04282 family arsenosugar biosynthesis glycosyltransferase [Myxococcota bacterium]|nr:TIGR04282 family arsenosugar biosynthesis glycosyltransferase [Myxococcota bacterium]
MRGVVVVFAKAPRAGLVKTRMTPPLSPAEAAELYTCLLDDVLEATAESARRLGLDAVVAVHPAEACAEIARRAPPIFRAVAQHGQDLAQRMRWAVSEAAAGGFTPVLLRGSDSPALDLSTFEEALAGLEREDVVISPDLDGGYNLIGLRTPAPALFDHPMSTGSVLADTLSSASSLGLRARILRGGFDLDTAADLQWLAEARRSGTPPCPRTLSFLDEHALWRYATLPPRPLQAALSTK